MSNSTEGSTRASQGNPIANRVHPPESTCLYCRTIADAVTYCRTRKWEKISLGDWNGLVERVDCETCQQIVHSFKNEWEEPMCTSCRLVLEDRGDDFWIYCESSPLGPREIEGHDHRPLFLTPPQSLTRGGVHSISVDPYRIDVSQLQQWLADCELNHRGECDKLFGFHPAEATPSLTLIDIQQSCLVIPKSRVKYVALSYVWGEIGGTLTATTHNVNYLSTPGSFEAPEIKSHLPRTILDAMFITSKMGIDFIWVDRLYGTNLFNASFTIIAADGQDANYGLRGIGGQALPRVRRQTYFNFSPAAKLLLEPDIEWPDNLPSWYTRAWTFQERAVSRRTLVFVNNTVYWQCRSATWREEIRVPLNHDSWVSRGADAEWPSHALTPQPWPDLSQYFSLVEGYNARKLSFETDALKAFTAIISAFSGSFQNGFLFGIPEFLFDVGLLWSASKPLKRRKDFPSWSWVGWSGEIEFSMKDAWLPEQRASFNLRVGPIINWKKTQNEDQSHVQIDNSYHIYRDNVDTTAIDSGTALLQGWTWEGKAFVHTSIPGKEFQYPFPIPATSEKPNLDRWSPLLTFRGETCLTFLGDPLEEHKSLTYFGPCLLIELKDQAGARVGVIESLFTSRHEYNQGNNVN